jgi:hypothetical protein
MPNHIAPKVNQIRTFLEIAENFRNPKEILREAISNLGMQMPMKFLLISSYRE